MQLKQALEEFQGYLKAELNRPAATIHFRQGVDINRLAQLLGHANIEKTAIYTHTDIEELKKAITLL